MIWFYLTGTLLILGGEINALLHKRKSFLMKIRTAGASYRGTDDVQAEKRRESIMTKHTKKAEAIINKTPKLPKNKTSGSANGQNGYH